MHQNRIQYSLKEYQSILYDRWNHTLFWFALKDNDSSNYNMFFAKPCPKTIWLPGRPRKKYLKARQKKLSYNFKKSADNYTFCTLTFSQKLYNRTDAFSFLKSYIHKFIKRLRKRVKTLQYYWVIELHKNGYPHIHIIFNQYVHWKVIRAIWWVVSRSRITDIRKIPGNNAGNYISKYVSKTNKHDQRQFEVIFKHVDRLFGYSQGFFVASESIQDIKKWYLISLSTNCLLPDWFLGRPCRDTDFWFIPENFASSLLYTDLIDHINWYPDFAEIYDYFRNITTNLEKIEYTKWWKIEHKDPDYFEKIPF